MRRLRIAFALSTVLFGAACSDSNGALTQAVRYDGGCTEIDAPSDYDVYFVVDVSGSMTPFLTNLRSELVGFAAGFPETDKRGEPVEVRYRVIGFKDDVRWYPEAGTSTTDVETVQEWLLSAAQAGETTANLNATAPNVSAEENLLDALAAVIEDEPSAEANLVLIATDQAFRERPWRLSDYYTVGAQYDEILAGLRSVDARVHAFTRGPIEGLTRAYGDQPALTSLDGSTVHELETLESEGASARVRETLFYIAREAACQ